MNDSNVKNVRVKKKKKTLLTQISIQSLSSSTWGDYIGPHLRQSQWQQQYAIYYYWSCLNILLYYRDVCLSDSSDNKCVKDLIDTKQISLIFSSAEWNEVIYLTTKMIYLLIKTFFKKKSPE